MSGLFLSYSRADRALADQIIRGLRAVGVAVWWDEDMRGVDWQMELEHRISELAGVMVIWTPHSLNSNPVRDEARLGLETDKLVNVLSGIPKPPFPYDRINGLPVDGWTGREPHRGWSRLVETVEELVVQKGGARPGDITIAQAMREQEIRTKQEAIAAALEASKTAETHHAEALEIAKAAAATATQAEEQLQRVAGMGVTPLILKAAQQEFESASAARRETDEARKSARAELEEAVRALTRAKADLEQLFSAVTAPVLPARKGPPAAPKARPSRADPPAASAAAPAATPPARPRKARAAHVPPAAPQPAAPAPVAAPAMAASGPAATAVAGVPAAAPERLAWAKAKWANPTARWVAIAGGIGAAVLIVAASLARHGQAPATPGPAAAVAAGGAPTQGQPAVADNDAVDLAGAWATPGTTCDDPVTLALDGDRLSVTSLGVSETGTVQPSSQAGVIHVRFNEGVSSLYIHRNHTLSVVDPSGATMKMTKCAG